MFFSSFSIVITSLGEELTLVLFVRLFDLCLFGLSVSSSSWCLGKTAVCDCGTPWTFLLPFFSVFYIYVKNITLLLILGNSNCWEGSNARQYDGTLSVTVNGYTCQAWTSHYPHVNYYDVDENFPIDGSAAAASNYSRDPGSDGYIWCYTMDPDVRWEYCDPPSCSGM